MSQKKVKIFYYSKRHDNNNGLKLQEVIINSNYKLRKNFLKTKKNDITTNCSGNMLSFTKGVQADMQ